MDDKDPTAHVPLKDLCAPLSAKVLPRSAKYSISGKEMTDEKAIQSSRRKADSRYRSLKCRATKQK